MSKYSFEFKLKVVNGYLSGKGGYRFLSNKYGISEYRPGVQLLKVKGFIVNHKKVQRLMKKLGLCMTLFWRKSRKYNSYKGKVGMVAKNKLHRRFNTSIPHQKITTDTTEFKYNEYGIQKKAYLNPFLDLYNNEILSFELSKKLRTKQSQLHYIRPLNEPLTVPIVELSTLTRGRLVRCQATFIRSDNIASSNL